jgi:hypothetical protein
MMTKKLGVAAVAAGMLAVPAAAVADSTIAGATPLVSLANQTVLAQPLGLGPVATPLGACTTRVRWVKPRGAEGGHYDAACPQPSWVPARGAEGGRYDYAATGCVRWVPPRGTGGGHYVGTCSPQPRWVPAHGPRGGHYVYAGSLTTPSSTRPTATSTKASGAPAWDFDFESAGIGAAIVLAGLAIVLATTGGLRGRAIPGPRTH